MAGNLPRRAVESGRGAQDPWADAFGERVEDGGVALAGVRHAQQTQRRRREQQ